MNIEIPLEELQKRKLFLATPMYGGVCAGMFAKSVSDLAATCKEHGIALQMYFLFNESLVTMLANYGVATKFSFLFNESLIQRARNYITDEFLNRSDCTHMMFIDSDIGFDPRDVLALLALCSDDSPYDIIGGPYPKKCIAWEKIKHAVDKGVADKDPNVLENFVGDYVFNPKGGQQSIAINEPVEVLEIGTGFMMMRKNSLSKFANAFPHYSYKPDHVRTAQFDGTRKIMMYFQAEQDRYDPEELFRQTIEKAAKGDLTQEEAAHTLKLSQEKIAASSERYLSEDYWFCQKAQEIGLRTWFCPWMKMQHVGTYIFGGSLADLASIGAPATASTDMLKKKT